MLTYTIGVVGHRNNRAGDYLGSIEPSLVDTLHTLAASAAGTGYGSSLFLVGPYNGIDRLAFKAICALKVAHPEYGIQVKVVFPDRLFTIKGKKGHQEAMQALMELSDGCIYLDEVEQKYSDAMLDKLWELHTKFSKYIVDNSDTLVAVWDGVEGSCTANTIEYAKRRGGSVATIDLTGQLAIISA